MVFPVGAEERGEGEDGGGQGDTEEEIKESQGESAVSSTKMNPRRGGTGGGKTVIRKAEFKSGVTGVIWSGQCGGLWDAKWIAKGVQHHKLFSVKKHGFEEAKRLAIEFRRKMEAEGRAGVQKARK